MVEIGSEALLLITSIFLAQFLNEELEPYQALALENFTIASFGLMLVINIAYMIWFIINNCKENRRKKKL